jgi:cytochrome bd-type quinol oxidase subunit 2
MGIVLGIPLFAFLIFGPAFFILRSKRGNSKQRAKWAALTVLVAFAFALVVGLVVYLVGRALELDLMQQKFGWLGNVSLVGTVGFFAIPWVVYAAFKRKADDAA